MMHYIFILVLRACIYDHNIIYCWNMFFARYFIGNFKRLWSLSTLREEENVRDSSSYAMGEQRVLHLFNFVLVFVFFYL